MTEQELRISIAQLVEEFYKAKTVDNKFVLGKTAIRYARRVFDEKEIQAAVEASLDFWLTEGALCTAISNRTCHQDWCEVCLSGQLRFICQSFGAFGPDLAFIGRPQIETG